MSAITSSRAYFNDSVIDGTQAGTTTIETTVTESGVDRRFHCLIVDAVPCEVENVTEGPIISVGTNSPNYNNVVSAQLIDTLVVGGIAKLILSSNLAEIGEGVDLRCKVITPAVPELLQTPTFDFKVTLMGVDHLY